MKPLQNRAFRAIAGLAPVLVLVLMTGAAVAAADSAAAGIGPLLSRAAEIEATGRAAEAVALYREALRQQPGSAEVALRLGKLLGRMGYLGEARAHLRVAAAAAPERAETHLELGKILEKMFDHAGAETAFLRVLALDPEPWLRYAARVGRGIVQERTGRLTEAIASYRAVLDVHPDSPSALAHLGIAQRMHGDFDGAVDSWQRYLELRPGSGWVSSWLRQTEATRAGLAAASRALEAEDPGPDPWNRIGELRLDAGDRDGAAAALDRAAAAGAAPGTRLLRAEVLQEIDRWKDADRELTRYLALRPGERPALFRLALGRQRLDDCVGERDAWRRLADRRGNPIAYRRMLQVIACGSDTGDATRDEQLATEARRLQEAIDATGAPGERLYLGLVREAQGRIGEGFDQVRAALQANPHHGYRLHEFRRMATDHPEQALVFAHRLRNAIRTQRPSMADLLLFGYLVWLGGDTDTPVRLFQTAEQIEPGHPDVQVARAHALSILSGDRDGALVLLRAAATEHPDSPGLLLALGLMEMENHELQAAIETGEKLNTIDPGSYHALGLLGSAHAAAGRHDTAVGYLLEAMRADPTDPEETIRFQLALSLAAVDKMAEARWILRSDLPWPPGEIYHRAWQLAREYFVDRSYGGENFQSWRHRFEGELRDRDDAYRAIVEMLAALDDRWTRLRRPEETDVVFLSRRSDAIDLDRHGHPLPTSRTVVSEEIEGGIRYLRLTNLSDPNLLEEVRRSLAAGDGGVILDLRGNPGGIQGESEGVGSLFLEAGTPMGEQVDRYGRRPVEAGGEDPIDPDRPLVVLVDENTGSAAEALAGALRESGRAKLIGVRTRGKGAAQVSQILPGGAMVLLTAARNITPDGGEIEGIGLQPDIPIDATDESDWLDTARKVLEEEKQDEQ